MLLLIDESLPAWLASALAGSPHDALAASEIGLRSLPDDRIFQEAQRRGAAVVAADLDFIKLARAAGGRHHGVVIVRYSSKVAMRRIESEVVERLRQLAEKDIKGNIVMIEPERTRIREASP